AGLQPSPIIDRFWFRSIYFREPNGILFEIATLGPGFSMDEDPEHLGESLILPPAFEHLRSQVEPILTPLPDARPWAKTRSVPLLHPGLVGDEAPERVELEVPHPRRDEVDPFRVHERDPPGLVHDSTVDPSPEGRSPLRIALLE